MRSFAIIGLGRFGQCMLETLVRKRLRVVVVDLSEEKVQWARDLATQAVKADALNFEVLQEVLPDGIHAAIVDLGDQMERSILVTNYLQKLRIPEIIVEAANPQHAEILEIVGATRIVYPENEAAERLAGLLAGRGTLDYFAVSAAFSLVEIPVPPAWVGKTLAELDLRRTRKVNIVAHRKPAESEEDERWELAGPDHRFESNDFILVAGDADHLERIQR